MVIRGSKREWTSKWELNLVEIGTSFIVRSVGSGPVDWAATAEVDDVRGQGCVHYDVVRFEVSVQNVFGRQKTKA